MILTGTGRIAWQVVGIALVLWIAGRAYTQLSLVLLSVFVALVVAAAVVPAADRLERIGLHRTLATAVTVVGLLLLLAGTGVVLTLRVDDQLPGLAEGLRDQREPVLSWLERSPLRLSPDEVEALLDLGVTQLSDTDDATDAVTVEADTDGDAQGAGGTTVEDGQPSLVDDEQGPSPGLTVAVLSQVLSATRTLGFVLIGFVLAFFLVRDRRSITDAVVDRLVGGEHDELADIVLGRAWRALLGYVRASLLVGLVDAALIGSVLVIVGVPLAGVLTVLTFLAAFVPVVGAVAVGALSAVVALVTQGVGAAVVVTVAIVLVQQLDGNVLQPVLMREGTGLHPVATILALTIGALLGGVLGALLAVPVTAVLVAAAGALMDAGVGLPDGPSVAAADGDGRDDPSVTVR